MRTNQRLVRPVFIVGLPRTGSTMLMNIINNNRFADYHLANEVQFFGHSRLGRILQGRRGVMPIVLNSKDESGRIRWDRVMDALYSGKAKGVHWNGLTVGWLNIPKEKLLASLAQTDGSPRAVYEAILTTQEREYTGYGDKSCPNLYFMNVLLKWFPDCRIIHIIRDPRAILMSQYKRLMADFESRRDKSSKLVRAVKKVCYSGMILTYILTYWGYAVRTDRRFSKSHPDNYMLIQYEELILKPEEITKRICDFLSVKWDNRMVTPPRRGSSYTDRYPKESEAGEGTTGMDREALDRWRRHMPGWMSWAAKLHGVLCYRTELRRFGYVDRVR